MMTDWYQKAIDALQLNGLGERTQEASVRAVRLLCQFYDKTPDQISEFELQPYFLHRKNRDGGSPNTMRIGYGGIRFFFVHVVQRNWHTLELIRAQSEHRLPVVLSREEVRRLLGCVRTPHNRVFLSTVYAGGLRLQEAQCLEVAAIDSQRMMSHGHRGQGAKDRYVPLPQATLARLRAHGKTHRHRRWLFPALGRSGQGARTASTPMAKASVQGALRQARVEAGIHKRHVSVHTLRHCYATHLLEAGVNRRVIQPYLGPAQLETTMVYLHLTQKGQEDAYQRINGLMEGL